MPRIGFKLTGAQLVHRLLQARHPQKCYGNQRKEQDLMAAQWGPVKVAGDVYMIIRRDQTQVLLHQKAQVSIT